MVQTKLVERVFAMMIVSVKIVLCMHHLGKIMINLIQHLYELKQTKMIDFVQ